MQQGLWLDTINATGIMLLLCCWGMPWCRHMQLLLWKSCYSSTAPNVVAAPTAAALAWCFINCMLIQPQLHPQLRMMQQRCRSVHAVEAF